MSFLSRLYGLSVLLVIFLLLTLGVSNALAEKEAIVVGFVDMQRALSSSIEGKKAQKEYEQKVKSVQSELDKKKQEFSRMREDFGKQKASLNELARTEKEEKLIVVEKDLKRLFEDSQESLRRENIKVVGDLLKKLHAVVDEVGRRDGFTIILEKSSQAVLYADNKIDITDKVIQQFDKTQ